ncbi:hypothetical protein QJU00_20270, partial [Bordetella bronchiseptica]
MTAPSTSHLSRLCLAALLAVALPALPGAAAQPGAAADPLAAAGILATLGLYRRDDLFGRARDLSPAFEKAAHALQ